VEISEQTYSVAHEQIPRFKATVDLVDPAKHSQQRLFDPWVRRGVLGAVA